MKAQTPTLWQRFGELFDRAATMTASQRADFLASLAGDDAGLRDELEKLLADDAAPGLLDRDVRDLATRIPVADEETLIGKTVGHWRIVDILGHGGMGAVYRAERADGAYTQAAALKLIRLGVDSPEARARFLRERQFLASLQHPNIATLLDGGVTPDGTPYLAMELIDGERIDAYCDAHRLTLAQRLRLMLQVLAAVQHAHQSLIVHRDLKPSNILVTTDCTAKLLDFGIATAIDTGGAFTVTRDHPLTPEYAAPEQIAGKQVTTATDVYALGLILAQLLGGIKPSPDIISTGSFSLASAVLGAEAEAIARARSTNPRQLVRTLRGDLGTIVRRALAHESARRYPSAQSLATDIELCLAARPILARPDSLFYRARMFVRRNRVATALAAATVLVMCVTTAFSLRQAHLAREAARDAETRALSLRAVSDTLDNMLRGEQFLADVNGPASAARLLGKNVEALDFFLIDQPLAHASLLWRYGRGLRLAGDSSTAVTVLRNASDAFTKAGASTSLDGREATLELARALIGAGDASSAAATLDALETSLQGDEINVDLHRHVISLLRARMALASGRLEEASKQIAVALALAPTPSGEHGARYSITELLAGTILLEQNATIPAADAFADAFEAMAADPRAELAPPHQALAPAIETLALLGDAEAARIYATRWQDLCAKFFGGESARARSASELHDRLMVPLPTAKADAPRAARLHKALDAYWSATFDKYDTTQDYRTLSLDRDP